MAHARYAIYWLPEGPLAAFGAAWLGHDIATGRAPSGPPNPEADLVAPARRYGLHATLKPPFRLAPGTTPRALSDATAALAARLPPTGSAGLALADLHGFLALRPEGDTAALDATVAEIVRALDPFRAPPSEDELARRRSAGLTPRQEANLAAWGYPYVMEDFRFHVTLTGRLSPADRERLTAALAPRLAAHLPRPFLLDRIALVGEQPDGSFVHLETHPLTG